MDKYIVRQEEEQVNRQVKQNYYNINKIYTHNLGYLSSTRFNQQSVKADFILKRLSLGV